MRSQPGTVQATSFSSRAASFCLAGGAQVLGRRPVGGEGLELRVDRPGPGVARSRGRHSGAACPPAWRASSCTGRTSPRRQSRAQTRSPPRVSAALPPNCSQVRAHPATRQGIVFAPRRSASVNPPSDMTSPIWCTRATFMARGSEAEDARPASESVSAGSSGSARSPRRAGRGDRRRRSARCWHPCPSSAPQASACGQALRLSRLRCSSTILRPPCRSRSRTFRPSRSGWSSRSPGPTSLPVSTRAYNDLRREVHLKGFRPGKAPRQVLEKLYRHRVEDDVARDLVELSLGQAIRDKQIDPVAPPRVDKMELKSGEPFKFSARVEVRSQVEPKNYTGIPLDRRAAKVTPRAARRGAGRLPEAADHLCPRRGPGGRPAERRAAGRGARQGGRAQGQEEQRRRRPG